MASSCFLTLNQDFKLTGTALGILGSILNFNPDDFAVNPTETKNSVGIFQRPNGDFEAVIVRLEMPPRSLFGLVPSPRAGIHFQHLKGSEI